MFLTEIDTEANTQDVAAAGELLFSVNSSNVGNGLVIHEVSDPAAPAPISVFDTTNGTMGVGVQDGLCALANGFGGLRLVDVSNPASPVLLSDLFIGAMAFDAQPVGDVVYMASFGGGMLSIDVSSPMMPAIMDQEMWGYLNAVDIAEGYAWVADGQQGLRVVDISNPASLGVAVHAAGGRPGPRRGPLAHGLELRLRGQRFRRPARHRGQ